MPFFERNSFVLRQLLQPGWVNKTNLSFVISIVTSSLGPAKLRGTYQPKRIVSIARRDRASGWLRYSAVRDKQITDSTTKHTKVSTVIFQTSCS